MNLKEEITALRLDMFQYAPTTLEKGGIIDPEEGPSGRREMKRAATLLQHANIIDPRTRTGLAKGILKLPVTDDAVVEALEQRVMGERAEALAQKTAASRMSAGDDFTFTRDEFESMRSDINKRLLTNNGMVGDLFYPLRDALAPIHGDSVVSLAFDPGKDRLYSSSFDDTAAEWSLSSRSRTATLVHSDWVNAIVLMQLKASESKKDPLSFKGPRPPAELSTSLSYIVTGCEDGCITFWSPETHQIVQQLCPATGAPITNLHVGGDLLFAASLRLVYVVSASTGTIIREFTHRSDATSLATFEDQLFVGSVDGYIFTWDISGAYILRETSAHLGQSVRSLLLPVNEQTDEKLFIPGTFVQTLFSGGEDGTVKIWAVSSGLCLKTISLLNGVRCLCIHQTMKDIFLYIGTDNGDISCISLNSGVSLPVYTPAATPNHLLLCDLNGKSSLVVGCYNGLIEIVPTGGFEKRISSEQQK